MSHLILQFVAGRHQGAAYPILEDREVVIGRDSWNDVVLLDDLASRRHARLVSRDDGVWLHDERSNNGTFVNGQRIERRLLAVGDRILIGSSMIRVAEAEGPGWTEAEGRRRLMAAANLQPTHAVRSLGGVLDDVPLPDLLQLLATTRKTGVLCLHQVGGRTGRVHLRDGQVVHAEVSDGVEGAPLKALFRLLAWPSGGFSVEPPAEGVGDQPLAGSVQALLLRAVKDADDLARLLPLLPPRVGWESLQLPPPGGPMSAVDGDVVALIGAEEEPMETTRLLDASPHADGETAASLARLLGRATPEEDEPIW